jgi:hypothetical protein
MTVTMRDFPNGSCGDASLLLARYLRDNNAGEFQYVLGERGVGEHWTSHAWLEQNEIVVDITADQFEGFAIPVLVSISSPFHDEFEKNRDQTSDYRDYDVNTRHNLESTYSAILSCVQK